MYSAFYKEGADQGASPSSHNSMQALLNREKPVQSHVPHYIHILTQPSQLSEK